VQLFRGEAMRGQDRLHGEVVLVPPLSWQIIGIFLLLVVAAAGIFLATATYGKATVLQGEITGNKGLVRAVAPQDGIVLEVLVREGQRVRAGTPLARISVATSDGAASLQERRAAAIARQDRLLREAAPDIGQALRSRISGLRAQVAGDRAEMGSIAAQIAEQQELVRTAADDLARARSVAARGFVSRQEVIEREEQLATRRQGLARLGQELSVRRTRVSVAEAELVRAEAEAGLQIGDVDRARAELSGIAAADENAAALVVTASQAGTVTGVSVHAGDAVTRSSHLLTLIPDGTRLEARIQVPSEAAGLIEPGQRVRIAVDAFPYQTYGTVDATVQSMSMAAVPVAGPEGATRHMFLVRATLGSEAVRAHGRPRPLRPGMNVRARVRTQSRSLAEWLFEPLYAIQRR
jgi:membrane fusion protein